MKAIYCDVCRNIPGRINTKRGFVCWECYNAENKMFKRQDIRDKTIDEYMKNNDLLPHEGETPRNLANRCKRLVIESGTKLN
jgi:hypothetical protein